ncbi:MAG: hypothetical protein EPO08_21220 [Rhodospirillaceae bacterium]|nr:MAG: hypothetical protein EPO08_21220 [Rhodospirillaceae bacterium]
MQLRSPKGKGKRRNPKDPPAEYRWKPGQSGNPTGLGNPGKTISQTLRELLKMPADELVKFRARKDLIGTERIALRWMDRMENQEVKGNAAQLLSMGLDRTEGAVKQTHVLEGGLSPVTDPAELARRLAADSAPGTPPSTENA